MNYERRRFLLSAALCSTAVSSRGSAWSAESGAGPAHPQEPPSNETVIELDAHARSSESTAGADAPLTYGGSGPGPILRVKKDQQAKIHLTNRLGEATSLDWHGMRLANTLEITPGLLGAPLAPGRSADIVLIPVDSGSYWFHPGLIPGLSDQTARGLAGVVVVEEAGAPPVNGDKILFLTDGAAKLAAAQPPGPRPSGVLGGILVNGMAFPETESFLPGVRLRLRIINGSTRQALAATFQGARPLVVAIDGQPSELFAPLNNTVPVGPGARFDVMVDLPRTPRSEFKVLLRGPDAATIVQPDQSVYVARTEGNPLAERDPITPLPPNPSLPRSIPLEHSTRADMVVQLRREAKPTTAVAAWTVNGFGTGALPKKPLFSVKRNTPVTLGFSNRSAELTAFRLHGHVMRLLHAMDDGWEPYWRDSVLVPPGVTHHAAFLADNPGRWLIDSPFFEQATSGLRTWFEVL